MEAPLLISTDFELFQNAERLIQKTDDPENAPYTSKYEARKLLEAFECKLNLLYLSTKQQQQHSPSEIPQSNLFDVSCSFALILYKLGVNYCETDERSSGEKCLLNAQQLLKQSFLNLNDETSFVEPKLINIYISVENYLAFIYSNRSDDEKALVCLRGAKRAYECFKKHDESLSLYPTDPVQCLKKCCNIELDQETPEFKEECWLKFERLYTYTLFYLAQLYKNLNKLQESALFCHETLVRQLNYKDHEPLEWSLNSATLSQFYINNEETLNFSISRQCLASALAMLDKHSDDNSINENEINEKYLQCKADIYRCFAKYGLALLDKSKDRYFELSENFDGKLKISDDEVDAEEKILFERLNFGKYMELISDKFAADFQSARCIFLAVQGFLNKAKEFYQLDGRATDYIEIIQDYNRAYKLLITFELDLDRKCQMHKRRFDLLNNLIKELNPIHFLNQCRQMYMDLGEISSELLDIKFEKLENQNQLVDSSSLSLYDDTTKNKSLDSHKISKINYLAQQSIKFYQLFLDSYKNNEGKMPEKFDSSQIRPIIVAQLATGRLYNKMLTTDKRQKIAFCQQAYERFKWIVNYCENIDTSIVDLVQSEFDVSKDMMQLYLVKIDRLRCTL